MCLLITQKASAPMIDDHQIEDFYWYNSDGIGVMYSDGSDIVVKKALPRDREDCINFWREYVDGKDCAVHLRMRTHGAVDLENCHPYLVLPGLWLMHNGILSIGNDDDKTKSDTWHYIERYLKPLLKGDVDLAFDPAFIEIISDHIGPSNKFVMMDYQGRIAHFNRESGMEWNDRWMSNTYAWTLPGERRGHSRRYGYNSYYSNVGREDAYAGYDYAWEAGIYKNSNKAALLSSDERVREIGVTFTPNGWDEDDAPKVPVDYDVEEALEYLESAGFYRAASVSKKQAVAFANKFDASAVWDLASMLDNGDIDEYQFIKFISDFRLYREMVCGC